MECCYYKQLGALQKGLTSPFLKHFYGRRIWAQGTRGVLIYMYIYIYVIYIYIYVIYIYIIFHILFHILYILFSIYYFLVITTVDLIKYMQFFAWQSIYGGGNKQNEKMGTFLVRYRNTGNTGDTGNIIQRDNSAGH